MERAGFEHVAIVELDTDACGTLRRNRPTWPVFEQDVAAFDARPYAGVDLLAGGVPCPPFSIAGKQLGMDDERDLFPEALRLVEECRPRAVMLENVRGFLAPRFAAYRELVTHTLNRLGYKVYWALLNASDYGVAQLRPRTVIVALQRALAGYFEWPEPRRTPAPTVGEALLDLMKARGWEHAETWARQADRVAPTLVGGSKKHGGAALGPSRARKSWAQLGVSASALAEDPPAPGYREMPRLTLRMAALLQGFPPEWAFEGRKTSVYRQIANAFPPPVAEAVGSAVSASLTLAGTGLTQGRAA
jgi:DNA (cytosine-5)-methyltransferase 1